MNVKDSPGNDIQHNFLGITCFHWHHVTSANFLQAKPRGLCKHKARSFIFQKPGPRFSPRLCVGFLFLILYPGSPPASSLLLPPPPSSSRLSHTQLCHIPSCHIPSFTYNKFTHTNLAHNFVTYHLSHTITSNTQT